MRHIFRAGLVLTLCAGATNAWAGFEFVPPPATAVSTSQNAQTGGGLPPMQGSLEADLAMPAAPTAEVTQIPLTPAANEAIDTRGLLAATSQGMPVSIAPPQNGGGYAAPRPGPASVTASGADRLFINPYPLDGQGMNAPGADPVLAQAMTGQVQAYGAGNNAMQQPPVYPTPANSSMMPMPGGEGEPLYPEGRISTLQPSSYTPPSAPARISRDVPRGPQDIAAPYANAVPVQQTYAPAVQGGFTEAVGFGRELPLALAMSQVVPPEYTYSFAGNVDKGATVSWQGGKPWNVVLDEMLAPSGMRAMISNNQVTIVKAA